MPFMIHHRSDLSAGPIRLLPVSPFGSDSDRHTTQGIHKRTFRPNRASRSVQSRGALHSKVSAHSRTHRHTNKYEYLQPVRDGKNETLLWENLNSAVCAADEIAPANSVMTYI